MIYFVLCATSTRCTKNDKTLKAVITMYCENLDSYLNILINDGAVKLPSVKSAKWRPSLYKSCLDEMGSKNYGENLSSNQAFLKESFILDDLKPRLARIAYDVFGISVKTDDVYNVCRLVRPGDNSEGYRGHFDSHLFTLVTPINIPQSENSDNCGELHYFPYCRKQPKNEIVNIYDKIRFKKYNSSKGFNQLSETKACLTENFLDYQPLLFLGNTTFHGNSPVDKNLSDNRMTILTHFFDPSSRFGAGRVMRLLRRR